MRLALIAPLVSPISDLHLGGAQAVVADLGRELTRRGHDVVVYAGRGSAIDGVALADVDVDTTLLQTDLFRDLQQQAASPAMVEAYRAVYADARDRGFDVVHNHGFDAPAVSVAAELGLPVLHTLHLPPRSTIADAISTARRDSVAVWCAAVSQAHGAAWSALVSVDAVLRNGVPVDEIRFNPQGGRTAVIAARFSAEKGVDDGIDAARRAGWPVEVYGTPYDSEYERSVRGRWAGDTDVQFHDPVPRTALWDALGSAGAVICLSRWEEPFGMVAAEAQAAGTPVIASRAGGLAAVVDDGVTGWLVSPGDVEAAARALSAVPGLSRRACRVHAETSLSLAASVDAHEALYTRLAGRG